MVKNNENVFWEDEDGIDHEIFMSDILINQSSPPSPNEGYLDDQYVLNNFSLSRQGGDSNSLMPLGLNLKKTPSLLDMVQQSVSEAKSKKIDIDHLGRRQSDRVKAGNFPAASIKIGNWQRFSSREGDLTAKVYYAKRKFVWEVLEGGLKCKIEIRWSEISAIRAIMPENQPGTLEIELTQPPSYFQEANPQPRKHTTWDQAPDFTGGQASIWRRHMVRFKPGTLDKHYEKLLQCNKRLFEMSMEPFPSHESPYFGNSEMPLSLNEPYESSYYQEVQNSYQPFHTPPGGSSLTLPQSMPAMNSGYNNDSNHYMTHQPRTFWNEGPSHNNQVYDQKTQYPNYYDHPPHVEILNDIENHLLGDAINPNPGYDYANNQYQYAPPPPQQYYADNGAAMNYQGGSYHYPGYNPTSGNFF